MSYWDDEEELLADPVVGTTIPLGQYMVRKKLWHRPIGFMANIDNLIDDEGNERERRIQKIPLKSGSDQGKKQSQQGAKKAGQSRKSPKGRRKGSRPRRRQSNEQLGYQPESQIQAREPG